MRPEVIEFPEDIPVRAFVGNVTRYPYHWHKALEIIVVLQGQVYIGMGGQTYFLEENNIAVINGDDLHRINPCCGDNKLLIIQVDSVFCEKVNPDYKYAFIYCCSPFQESEAPEKYSELKGHIARLVYQLSRKSCKKHKEAVKDCLEKMLSHMIDSFDYLRFGPGIKAFEEKQAKRIRKMYEHIMKAPNVRYGLKELAAEAEISLYHMSHDIKDKFGYTFQELLYYNKCKYAARLLLGTDKRIAKISSECGFSDPKYLIKHFKLNYYSTPSAFRKMYQADDETLASQVQYQEDDISTALKYI